MIIGVTSSKGLPPLHRRRPRLLMCAARELRPRTVPYKRRESVAVLKRPQRQTTTTTTTDYCYRFTHCPLRLRSTQRELRPRRAPVSYYESEDDERPPPRPGPRARAEAAEKRCQATRRPLREAYNRAEADKRYRETHRTERAEADRRYRQQHLERLREKDRRYYDSNRERILARQQRYRETHREEVREAQRRYRESRPEETREKQRRYREGHREKLREQERQRYARYRETHPELVRKQNRIRQARFRAKKRMEKLRTLTIPLTDCRRPVTDYLQTFCDSLDSEDTPLPESQDSVDTPLPESQDSEDTPLPELQDSEDTPLPESFLQLLEEDSHTVLDLDSGTLQVSEPSDCNDLSFLQDLLSPDEWGQVMDDVQDFDVDDWLEDMTPSDEGVDLMYDLVS